MASPNFRLGEFLVTNSGLPNIPTWAALENIKAAAAGMEKVRALLGAPITITSGYRSPQVNAAVGGVSNSDHMTGFAVDFRAAGLSDSPG
jgi:putative chitinase